MIPSSFKCDTVTPTLPGKQGCCFSVSGSRSHLFVFVLHLCTLEWSSGWVYLVQWVNAGLVTDSQVMFELPHGPHARPHVLLANRQQQRGDGVVKLRNTDWIPGTQEHNICRTNSDTETRSGRHTSLKHKLIIINHLDVINLRDFADYFYFLGTGNNSLSFL